MEEAFEDFQRATEKWPGYIRRGLEYLGVELELDVNRLYAAAAVLVLCGIVMPYFLFQGSEPPKQPETAGKPGSTKAAKQQKARGAPRRGRIK